MEDKFCLKLNCINCGTVNHIDFGANDFICSNQDIRIEKVDIHTGKVLDVSKSLGACNTINFICADFRVKRIEDVTEEDVIQTFEMVAIGNKALPLIRKEAKRYLKELKKRI